MSKSIQQKLGMIRPPRVHITYDLETEGAIIKKELPCIIGIIADLTGVKDDKFIKYAERKFVFIDGDNFNDVLKASQARVDLKIKLNDKIDTYPLSFNSFDDFDPQNIIQNIPILKERFDKRIRLSDLKVRISNSSALFDIATNVLKNKIADSSSEFKDYSFTSDTQKTYLIEIFNMLSTIEFVNDNVIVSLQKVIESIDIELNDILNQVLHDPSFQRLEGSWRGIRYMIKNLSLSSNLKIRILNADTKEIKKDLENAFDFDQSYLFKKLYEEEYGTYGGNPYSFLLIDHHISRNEDDFMFLHNLVDVVACAHIPTVLSIDPSMFDLNSFEKLHVPRDISKIFSSPELAKFTNFRVREDSRYVSFVLPNFMGRMPYNPKFKQIEGTNFVEDVSKHENFLWTNAIYLYGQRIGEAFFYYGWFASIIGPENGGMVSNLPVYTYKTENGDLIIKCPTETAITDRRERELSEQGFISLCHCKDTDYSVFFSGQSANKPLVFDKESANNNAKLSARFQYILNTSRFAHYIKCIMRDKIGTFANKEDIESFLNNWIAEYVLLTPEAPQEVKASYPLSQAKVIVNDVPGHVGRYSAVIYLKPHFQMEELTISLRLVAKIPGGE